MKTIDEKTAQALAILVDEAECRRIVSKYAPAVDWMDSKTLLDIFWPGATVDLGPGFFQGPVERYVATVIEQVEASYLRRMHMPGNIRLSVSGNTAEAENAGVNQVLNLDEAGAATHSLYTGRYLWKLERRGERWGICSMLFLYNSGLHTPYDRISEIAGLNFADGMSTRSPLFPGPADGGK